LGATFEPTTLLLDLDGTLAHTLPDLAWAVNRLREELGQPPLTVEKVRVNIGDGLHNLLRRSVGLDGEELEGWVEPWRAWYRDHICVDTHLLPGATDLLEAAAARDIPMALVTNKPAYLASLIVEELGIAGHLPVVVGGNCLPTKKPEPEMIHVALERLGRPDRGAWMVGDGPQDVGAAKRAGIPSAFVPGYGNREEATALGPDIEVPDLHALAERLSTG
jgi:phosphoglycolate phosphatase